MNDCRRMMVVPAEALIPVKGQSGKKQTFTMEDYFLHKLQDQFGRAEPCGTVCPTSKKSADRMIRAFPFLSQPISALTLPQAERLAEPPKIQRRAAPLELRGRARNVLLLLRCL